MPATTTRERQLWGVIAEMARDFDAEVESKMPISKAQLGADLIAMRKRRHLTSEQVAVIFNEQYAEFGLTLSGSSLRGYERGDTEIPYRTMELLLALYHPPGGRSQLADAYRADIRKAVGIKVLEP